MVTRGLGNLHINGILIPKYKFDSIVLTTFYRQMVASLPPSSAYQLAFQGKATLQKIKPLQEANYKSDDWQEVSIPSPPHSALDYVYTVDLDTASGQNYKSQSRYVE